MGFISSSCSCQKAGCLVYSNLSGSCNDEAPAQKAAAEVNESLLLKKKKELETEKSALPSKKNQIAGMRYPYFFHSSTNMK